MTQEKPKKKILLITRPIAPPWDEASKNFAFYLAKALPAFNFFLLTNGFLPNLPAHIHQKPIYTSNHLSYFQKMRLLKLVRMRNHFDIMHFMLTPSKLNAFSFKTFVARGHAKTIQTVATLREDLLEDKDFKEVLFADIIITYSDYAKNRLAALGFQNVVRIYPGIDLEYYKPAPKDPAAMRELGISADDFVVTYPGEYVRLGATDDIVNLIISYAEQWKNKKVKFWFACRLKNDKDAIGKKEEVVQKLKENNVLDLVIFTDIYPDMQQLYNLSDVVIFPVQNMIGKFDVPLAAIEPMACEKPVIVSDLPILKEFANAQNSVTIQRGNIAQLRDAIMDLYVDEDKRKTIGKGGRKFCEKNFDIKSVAEQYKTVYDKL